MKLHHYKSDFIIAVKLFKPSVSGEQEPVMIPGRIKIEFFTEGGLERISVERNGDSFSCCSLADGGKTLKAALPLSRHCVGTGDLMQVVTIYENDSLFPEGVKRVLSPKHTGVVLHAGASDDDNIVEIENAVSLVPKYCGVYTSSKTYDKDDIVTHKGSAFISTKTQSGVAPSVSWGPDHSSFVVNDGWELFAGVDMPFIINSFSALQTRKADKDGYHCDMAVGKADAAGQLVDGKAAVSDTASYRMRTAGGSKDIETGVSAITKIYGRTEKQYIENGDFKTSEGWTNTGGTLSISKGLLSWAAGGDGYNDARSLYIIRVVKNHKILVLGFTRFSENTTNGNIYTNPATAGEGMQKNTVDTLSVKGSWAITGQICSYDRSGDVRIILGSSYNAGSSAKIAWVKMYDLTELGLEHLTTVQQAAAYFGGGYCEGLQGANLLAKHTAGFNQFSHAGRECGVLKEKAISLIGGVYKIIPGSIFSVIYFSCIKSELGAGKNNGYRIHTPGFADGYTVVGWSPFRYGDARLDTILQCDSVLNKNTIDYANNGDGYIYVSLKTTDDAIINKIIAHFKHSYTDFSKQYAEEAKYKLSSKRTPYGELHSIRDVKDEIDLVAKKKIQRIGVRVLDGSENWKQQSGDIYYIDALGGKPGTPELCNHYGGHSAAITDMEDQTCLWSDDSKFYIRDSDAASVEGLKTKLSGLHAADIPVKVYYVLAEPVITDIEVGSNAQSINDFGTEELEYEGAMPEITTEYYNNLVDKLRNLPAPSEVAVVNPSKGDHSALRALFTAAGAIYNKATGFYELNGLTDITEEEMIVIYNSSSPLLNIPWIDGQYSGMRMRTNFPPVSDIVRFSTRSSGNSVFGRCSNIEIICATALPIVSLYLQDTSLYQTFAQCSKLRVISGQLNVKNSSFNEAFSGCHSLEDLSLVNLSKRVSFSDSPRLSDASVLFMIKNAANRTKDITITLHPEAKARAAANAEIQAAIANNGHITIV